MARKFAFLILILTWSSTSYAGLSFFEPSALSLFKRIDKNEDKVITEYLERIRPGVKLHLLPALLSNRSVSPENFIRHIKDDVNADRSADVIRYLSANKTAFIAALTAYKKHLTSLPLEERVYLQSSFERIQGILNERRVPIPLPWRSVTGLTMFFAADDLAYSFFSSFIEPSNEYVWVQLVTNARKLIGLFTVCTLAYDLITATKSIPAMVNEYIAKYRSQSAAKRFIAATKQSLKFTEMTKAAATAHNVGRLKVEDVGRILVKLSLTNDKLEVERLRKNKWIQIVSRYVATRRVNKVMNKVAKELTPIELNQLNEFFVEQKQPQLKFDVQFSQLRAQNLMLQDFQEWMASDPETRKINLTAAYEEFSRTTLKKYVNSRKASTSLKLSMWGFTGFLTLGGLYAALGSDARMFDLPYSDFFREHGWTLATGSGLFGTFFLAIQLIVKPFWEMKNIKTLFERRSPPRLSYRDSNLIRRTIEFAGENLKITESTFTKKSMPARDFIEASVEKYFGDIMMFGDVYRAGMCETLVNKSTRL